MNAVEATVAMINWFKRRKEEGRLKRLLALALAHPSTTQILKVEKARFFIAETKDIVAAGGPHDRVLLGEYRGEWPVIKQATSDCHYYLGRCVSTRSASAISISAIIYSRRVVGFLFSSDSLSFPAISKADLSFHPSGSTLATASAPAEPKDFPSWLPKDLLIAAEIQRDYVFPVAFDDADSCEFFRWFRALQCGQFLLTRPGPDDEVEVFNELFLSVGEDDCGNLLALTRSPESKLVLLYHESTRAEPFEGGFRKFVKTNIG
jgi:hypothetical protein